MKIYIGTSGFGYAEWAGKFYPKGLKAEERLAYYAGRFNATEVNQSFYAMPRPAVLEDWARQVPRDFSFSFKAPARITHLKRLRGVEADLKAFVGITAELGPRLGVLNFQLPPSFKADLPRLESFLSLLPPRRKAAVEFRHASWFQASVYAALKRRKVALTLNDADVEGCPLLATAPWAVVKLRRVRYSGAELAGWARRLKELRCRELHVFFKHEETASGPRLAARLAGLLGV